MRGFPTGVRAQNPSVLGTRTRENLGWMDGACAAEKIGAFHEKGGGEVFQAVSPVCQFWSPILGKFRWSAFC